MSSKPWIEDSWKDSRGNRTSAHGKGSRWRVYWWEDVYTGGNLSRSRTSRKFRTRAEAEAFIVAQQVSRSSGSYISAKGGETRFSEIATEWLDSAHDIKESTYHRYARELRTYVLPRWGAMQLASISKRDVMAWVSQLASGTAPAAYTRRLKAEPSPGGMHRPLSAASIKHVFHVFSAVLAWAVDAGLIASSPTARVRLPRVIKADHVYLTHSEIAALSRAAEGIDGRPTDRDLVNFLAYTGLRINEALALRISDLDLPRRRLRVKAAWTKGKDGKMFIGTPKSGKARSVGIPAFLADDLRDLIAGKPADSFVFTAARGGALNDHNWRTRVFNLARTEAGLDDIGLTPHGLRHTAASAAIAAGADVKVIQQMLGHADAAETLNTYSHLWPDRVNEVADALNAARQSALRPVRTA